MGEPDVVDAEYVIDLDKGYDFKEPWAKRRKRKKPRGTRKRDFPKFTEDNREKILYISKIGMPLPGAAKIAGLAKKTIEHWLGKGEEISKRIEDGERVSKVEQELAQFYIDYGKATASPTAVLLKSLYDGAIGHEVNGKVILPDPATAKWLLSKLDPEHFGDKVKTEVSVSGKVGVDHQLHGGARELLAPMSVDQVAAVRELVVKQLEAGEKVDSEEEDS